MITRFMYLFCVSLLVFISGCADDSSSSSSNQSVSTDGTVGGTGIYTNVKEYFTAGPQTSAAASVNAKALYRDDNYHNDFEYNDNIDGTRLFFRYADNTTSEAVYNINGQNYNAIVDDMVYAGHNWIGLELEQLYNVDGTPSQTNRRTDRIGLLNIKTGEIIVVENSVFQTCQDLETLEVLGNNKAYFLCENSAYSLDLGTKEIVQTGTSKNDKFDDSYAVIFADGTGVYQMEPEHNRQNDIKFIDNDSIVAGDIAELPVKYFKDGQDNIMYFGADNVLYNLALENSILKASVQNNELVIPASALGPVRNEDDATAKFINKQVLLDRDAFYVYNVLENTVTKTLWNNTDFETMRPFISSSEDTEEHIFFGENGIAYVSGRSQIKYIPYVENAEPKTVNLPANTSANYEIDDITLIGDMLYFQLEDERTERETYYKADVTQNEITAEEYTGDKSIMKVIDIDITVTTPEDNSGNTGDSSDNTGDNSGSQDGNTSTDTGSNGNNTENTDNAENTENTGTDTAAGSTGSTETTDGLDTVTETSETAVN